MLFRSLSSFPVTIREDELMDGDDYDGVSLENMMDNDKMNSFVKSFEENLDKKRKPNKKIGIENFIEE